MKLPRRLCLSITLVSRPTSNTRELSDSTEPEAAVFRADLPFVFLIRDDRTDTILFLGRIVDPAPSNNGSD